MTGYALAFFILKILLILSPFLFLSAYGVVSNTIPILSVAAVVLLPL